MGKTTFHICITNNSTLDIPLDSSFFKCQQDINGHRPRQKDFDTACPTIYL